FLSALRELGGSAGNARLQAELGWQDGTYAAVRDELIDEGLVTRGRGRGGSVALTDAHGASPAPETAAPDPAPSRRGGARPAQPGLRKNGARGNNTRSNGGTAFEQTFRAIDNVLRNEAGQTTELDYTEQTSWMLFL